MEDWAIFLVSQFNLVYSGVNMIKKIFFIFSMSLLIADIDFAQLKSINIFSDYSSALSKRLNVSEAIAFGGGAEVNFDLGKNFSLSIESGYKLFSISQTNQLLDWGWDFWNNRYQNKIKSDLQADKNLSVVISSSQKLGIIPLMIHANYSYILTDKFTATGSIGSGVYFYTRTLYAIEKWSKKFPSENYVFTYSYRNFAPEKKGNPFVLSAGFDLSYEFIESFSLNAGVDYINVLLGSKNGGNNFLFTNELTTKLGIIFSY